MKNIIFTIAFLTAIASAPQVFGQTNTSTPETSNIETSQTTRLVPRLKASNEGDVNFSAGIGLGFGSFPVSANLDYTFKHNISAGVTASYFKFAGLLLDSGYSVLTIGARGSYHFGNLLPIPKELDLYGGFAISYRMALYDDIYGISPFNGVSLGLHAGARYYLTESIALYSELGNNTYVQTGVSFKF